MSFFSFSLLVYVLFKGYFFLLDWELFQLEGQFFAYSIILDWMSLSFLAVVFLISSCVMFYSEEYMMGETLKNSFAFVVFLFVFSMMFLIISPNFLSLILGWDGLGLVSFLLVVYYSNFKSYGAGMITCLSNRIGDGAILIAMGWMLSQGDLSFIFYKSFSAEVLIVAGFVVLAAMTKKSSNPLSAWLPAAMAAPTPVSALVHSSTLVTAGVYLLIRFYPLISLVWAGQVLFFLSALTMIMSSVGALYETDLKKIIALSTLSQLGLMMMALVAGFSVLAFFHLLTHALFKACLFLCAGSVIHIYGGSQDIRDLSVVGQFMPWTSASLGICSFALSGVPFLSAFYSKDKIIEESFEQGLGMIFLLFLMVSIALTMMYSMRLIKFITSENYPVGFSGVKDSVPMMWPISFLTLGAIFGGSFMGWLFLDLSYDNLFLSVKSGLLLMLIFGLMSGLLVNLPALGLTGFYSSLMWFLVSLSTKLPLFFGLNFSGQIWKWWDAGWSEKLGPKGLSLELNSLSGLSDLSFHLAYKYYLFTAFLLAFIWGWYIFCFHSLYKA
uniref:NADH-ubiquinone oxidoreductase chain 5 n=1 Tax=Fabaeformiscandona kushiroensis TaxID=1564202 RepID=A0A0S3PNJ6_9CRUS|nr:NADH dehydrogenase subunit 5 [Fabaeformiscandona kushiroensis]